MSLTTATAVPVSPPFLVGLPEGDVGGAVVPLATRAQQVHGRLQTLQHTLMPRYWAWEDSDTSSWTIALGFFGSATGTYFGLLGGVRAAADPSDLTGLVIAGVCTAMAVGAGFWHVFARWGHAARLKRKADAQSAPAVELRHPYAKLSETERAVIAVRAGRLLDGLRSERAVSPSLVNALAPMTSELERLPEEKRLEAQTIVKLVDAIVQPSGELARSLRVDTERLTHDVEALSAPARDTLAILVRGPLQVAIDAGDGHRWRLRRLLDAVNGKVTPYTTEVPKEPVGGKSDAPEIIGGVTISRAVTLLRGGLAEEREAGVAPRARTSIFPSSDTTRAEQTAAFFEQAGHRAAIFDNGERLTVTVYDAAQPPDGKYVTGA